MSDIKKIFLSFQCSNKFVISWTSMFNDATFLELLPLSDKVNDYVDLDGNIRTCGPRWEKVG